MISKHVIKSLRLKHGIYNDVSILNSMYTNGTPAMRLLTSEGVPILTATVNIPGDSELLPSGCQYIKSYSENKGLFEELQRVGVIKPLPITCWTGYVEVQAAKILV